MKRTRALQKSVFYYLKDYVLPQSGYVFQNTAFPLTVNETNASIYESSQPNWVYVDATDYPVKIYEDAVEVDAANYSVNYIDGSVLFNFVPTGDITADFYYDVYKILESWPDETFERDDLPCIIIDEIDGVPTGLQIGGGRLSTYSYAFQIFELSDDEARDVGDSIQEKFNHWLPVIDYGLGFPLNSDGTKNTSFSTITQFVGQSEIILRSASLVRPIDPLEREENRFLIMFDVQDISFPGRPATL